MSRAFAELSFTPSVLAEQDRQGSANDYAKFLDPDTDRRDRLGPKEIAFVSARDGFYQATVSETGWPYVQFRGGPAGFLKVLDDQRIAYADFRGNRQYISTGNLLHNDKVSLILMDYPNRRRLKLWGRAELVDKLEHKELLSSLTIDGYRASPERAVVISIKAFDWNCPQHIPQRMTLEELEPQFASLRNEIALFKSENQKLKNSLDLQN